MYVPNVVMLILIYERACVQYVNIGINMEIHKNDEN